MNFVYLKDRCVKSKMAPNTSYELSAAAGGQEGNYNISLGLQFILNTELMSVTFSNVIRSRKTTPNVI